MKLPRIDYQTDVHLYEQLLNGADRYRSYLFITSLIRFSLVIFIWGLVILQVIGSPIATFLTLPIIALYFSIELLSIRVRLEAARYAMKDLKESIHRKERSDVL